jgi:hypothetical protein
MIEVEGYLEHTGTTNFAAIEAMADVTVRLSIAPVLGDFDCHGFAQTVGLHFGSAGRELGVGGGDQQLKWECEPD